MRKIVIVVGDLVRFTVLAVLLALRIALAAVVAVVTPIVMPFLALLSGGGLLVAIGFACVGHWHDAAKGLCVLHLQRYICHRGRPGSAREPACI